MITEISIQKGSYCDILHNLFKFVYIYKDLVLCLRTNLLSPDRTRCVDVMPMVSSPLLIHVLRSIAGGREERILSRAISARGKKKRKKNLDVQIREKVSHKEDSSFYGLLEKEDGSHREQEGGWTWLAQKRCFTCKSINKIAC